MPAMLEAESKLTDRYQTTVPEVIRQALKLGRRDRIHYVIRSDGSLGGYNRGVRRKQALLRTESLTPV